MVSLLHQNKGMPPEIVGEWNNAVKRRPRVDMWKWSELHIRIPRRAGTPFPGKYRTSITPWVRGWFDALQDPAIREIYIRKGAQTGATQAMYAALCYWICEDPDPILVVMPSKEDAKEASDIRIMPLLKESARVREEMTGREDDLNKSEYKFRNCVARLIGANSPGKLASFPHRYLILDELDKYKASLGKEGSVVGLAQQRAKNFWNRVIVGISTPTTAAGYISRLVETGDFQQWFVPCPECDARFVMNFKNVAFDQKLPPREAALTAHYPCPECGHKITDEQKRDVVNQGEWRPTREPMDPSIRSFDLTGVYSFSDQCTFRGLVSKFLRVKDNRADLQDFVNSDLGELWEDAPTDSAEVEEIYAIRDRNPYGRGTCPTKDKFIPVLVCDVQQSYIVWTVWGMAPNDLWLIDHGTCSVPNDLKKIAVGPWYDANRKEHACMAQFIDSGYRTTEIYRYCLNNRRAIPLKGAKGSTMQAMPLRFQKLDRFPNGDAFPKGVPQLTLRHVHPSYFKDELIGLLHFDEANPDQWKHDPLRIHFHKEVGENFAKQITGEVPMETDPDTYGNTETYWKRIRANHYFDCAQYAMAFRWMVRRDLARLEKKGEGTS